jgi:hypothetical protein
MALATGTAHKFKPRGGWFGFLDELGLLDETEQLVLRHFRDYLLWIEHGSYTKSYKLITLSAIGQIADLSTGASVREIAAMARWMIFRDPELLVDLADATSAFTDISQPSSTEWEAYWRKNPVQAMTTAIKDQDPWFVEENGWLRFAHEIPQHMQSTLEIWTRELVEYRLHRYLLGQSAKRTGEIRRPIIAGAEINAAFLVEGNGPVATSVVIESAGGTGDRARNADYVTGVDAVLERLARMNARLMDAYIDTRKVADLSVADRRLQPTQGLHYPIDLAEIVDISGFRAALLRSMAVVGRAPGVNRGGNSRKRFRLILTFTEQMSPAHLADALATGEISRQSSASWNKGSVG